MIPGGSVFFANFAESFATFAVKIFYRKERNGRKARPRIGEVLCSKRASAATAETAS